MKIETSRKGKYLILTVRNVPKGQLDLANIKTFKSRIEDTVPLTEENVLLDMTDITYIDSSVIGYLVDLLNRFRNRSGTLALAGLNPKIKNILELANLTKFFAIFPSIESIGE